MQLNTEYKDEYAQTAYKILSERGLRSKTHVCSALHCSKETLDKWIAEHESLKNAVDMGLIEGEIKFRKRVSKKAFEPSSKVNTKLILALANDVYKINEDVHSVDVNIKATNGKSVEELMIEEGIPIPVNELEDFEPDD